MTDEDIILGTAEIVEVLEATGGIDTAAAKAVTVSNSNDSYLQVITADLELPDIIHIDSDGNPAAPTPAQEVFICTPSSAVVAEFSANDITPDQGDTITFTDASTNSPTFWCWDFGDGSSSILQNPTHTYIVPGQFTVTLITGNATDIGDVETKANYITVTGIPISSGLIQQLDGQNIVLGVGSNVSQMTDLSGNGNHATQTSASRQPDQEVAELNGLNTVNFLDEYFKYAQLTYKTAIYLIKITSGAFQRIEMTPLSDVSDTYSYGITYINGSEQLSVNTSPTTTELMRSANPVPNAWQIITCRNNGDVDEIYIDSALQQINQVVTYQMANTATNSFIGSTQNGADSGSPASELQNASIAEVLRYDDILTDAELAHNIAYLTDKYAL